MARYPYKPLSLPHETRVLTVSPGADGEKITCSLSHMQVDSPGAYEALSYCWSASISHPPKIDFDEEGAVAFYGEGVNEVGHVRLRDTLGDPRLDSLYIRLGGVLPPAEIVCDGMAVEIGGELARALQRMRREEEPLRIWVDALCINQDDVQERNEHVKMMGLIYARAAKVRVWLGDAIGTELPMRLTMSMISDIMTDIYAPGLSFADMTRRFLDHPRRGEVELEQLGQFLGRSWFERSWVIQEIANAKEVTIQSGYFILSWESLYLTLSTLRFLRLEGPINYPKGIKAVIMMGGLRQERQESYGAPLRQPLLELLEELRHFESTIPADKIYAILGLVAPHERIAVDYGKSSERVFTDFAVQRLRSGSLDILSHCVFSPRPSSLANLPSWVPDWTRPGAVEPFRIRGLRVRAGGTTKPQITAIDEASGTLKLKGRLLDVVDAVDEAAEIPWEERAEVFTAKPNPDGSMPPFQSVAERNAHRQDKDRLRVKASIDNILTNIAFPSKRFSWEQYEAAWRTFMCNRTRENEVPGPGYGPCWEETMAYFSFGDDAPELARRQMAASSVPFPESQKPVWRRTKTSEEESAATAGSSLSDDPTGNLEQGLGDAVARDEEEEREMYAKMRSTFLGAHSKWCYRRRFYRSEAGRYGWAVDGAKHGDVVAMFYGCDYPFILQPRGDGTYRIIGDCYIHGLMDGEGLGEEYTEEEFHLV